MGRYPPHGAEPNGQWSPGVLKYRSGGHRGLGTASRALKQHASHRPRLAAAAVRATESIWSAQAGQVLAACLFGRKRSLQLYQIARVFLHHARILYLVDT